MKKISKKRIKEEIEPIFFSKMDRIAYEDTGKLPYREISPGLYQIGGSTGPLTGEGGKDLFMKLLNEEIKKMTDGS